MMIRAPGSGLRRVGLVTVLAALLLLAGCGSSSKSTGSGGSSGSSASTPSAAFAAQTGAVCKAVDAEIKAITAQKPTSVAQLSSYVGQLITAIEKGVAKLKAIAPPAGKQAAYAKLLTLISGLTKRMKGVEAAAATGDLTKVQTESKEIAREASEIGKSHELVVLAKELGINECTKGATGAESEASTEAPVG